MINTIMNNEELNKVMSFIKKTPVPVETLLINISFLETTNRKLWEELQKCKEGK